MKDQSIYITQDASGVYKRSRIYRTALHTTVVLYGGGRGREAKGELGDLSAHGGVLIHSLAGLAYTIISINKRIGARNYKNIEYDFKRSYVKKRIKP